MNDITSFFAAVSHAIHIGQTFLKARTDSEKMLLEIQFRDAINRLQGEVADAQLRVNALLEANEALTKKVKDYEHWEQESARYLLQEIAPGILAYRLKPGDAGTDPQHWLYAACYHEKHKSILQRPSEGHDLVCPRNPAHRLTVGGESCMLAWGG